MKTLRIKTISATLVLTALTLTVNAQQGGRPQQRPGGGMGKETIAPEKMAEKQTDKLDQELELTDSQEKKIYAIYLKQAQEASKKREEAPKEKGERTEQFREEREAAMTAMKEQRLANLKEVMSVLNDEQKINFAILLSKKGNGKAQQGRPQGPRQGMQGQRGGQRGQQQGGKGVQQQRQQPNGGQQQRGGERGRRPEAPQQETSVE
ncbi:MAG: Spy/CpxP family protein refolding chaperone [Rikenellaceae bacterium]